MFFSFWAEFLCLQKRFCPTSHAGLSAHACEWWWDAPSRARPAHPAWAGLLLVCANAACLEKCLHWPVVLPLYNSVGLCFYSTPPICNLWSELCWHCHAGTLPIQHVLDLKLPKRKAKICATEMCMNLFPSPCFYSGSCSGNSSCYASLHRYFCAISHLISSYLSLVTAMPVFILGSLKYSTACFKQGCVLIPWDTELRLNVALNPATLHSVSLGQQPGSNMASLHQALTQFQMKLFFPAPKVFTFTFVSIVAEALPHPEFLIESPFKPFPTDFFLLSTYVHNVCFSLRVF